MKLHEIQLPIWESCSPGHEDSKNAWLFKIWQTYDQVMTFSKKAIEITKFDDFIGLLKPFISLLNLVGFEEVMLESYSSGKMLSKTHWLFKIW